MKKKIVFSFTNSGLFSEVNYLLLTILYAKKKNYELLLDYSSLECVDYITINKIFNFEAFNKVNSRVISNASTRSLKTYLYGYSGFSKLIRFIMYLGFNINYKYYSLINNVEIDLFQKHWNEIKNLRLKLSEEDNNFLFSILQSLWIHKQKENVNFNAKFIGVHVRRGDKITETGFLSLNTYIEEIRKQCKVYNTKEILLFTDFKEDGIKMNKILVGYNVTLKCIDEKGYFHKEFLKNSKKIKAEKTLLLCDIVNELSQSSHFIGANDGNLSAFITMLRQGKNLTDLRNSNRILY